MPPPTRKNIMNKMLSHGRKSKHTTHWRTRKNKQSGENRNPSPLKPKPTEPKKPKGKFWNNSNSNNHPDY